MAGRIAYANNLRLVIYSVAAGVSITAITYLHEMTGLTVFRNTQVFRGYPLYYWSNTYPGLASFVVAYVVVDIVFWLLIAFMLMFIAKLAVQKMRA